MSQVPGGRNRGDMALETKDSETETEDMYRLVQMSRVMWSFGGEAASP